MTLRVNSYGKTICPPTWSWDTSNFIWHDYDLWVILEGNGTMSTSQKSYNLSKGDCFCLVGNQHYICTHDPLNPLTVIHIHYDYIDSQGEPIRPYKGAPNLHRKIIDLSLLEGMLHRFLISTNPLYTTINSSPKEWLACILDVIADHDMTYDHQQSPIKRPLSIQVSEYLRDQPQLHHKVKDLAAIWGYSPDHFSRLFKADTGISLERYIIDTRIKQATLLLTNSNMTIKNIAHALGYKEIYHFSKQFKSTTGYAPSTFRKMILASNATL